MDAYEIMDGIDGEAIRRVLPRKIEQAADLVAESALDYAAAQDNPEVGDAEREQLAKIYRARRYQWEALKARQDRIDAVTKGATADPEGSSDGG